MTIDADLARLGELQAAVIEGDAATAERNELAFRLWAEGSLTQREIAAALDHADRSHGGGGITLDMIQKALSRIRRRRQDELLDAAVR